MRTKQEIEDRLDGNILELDARLDGPYDPGLSAVENQAWIQALSWVLEDDNPRDRRDEIKEALDQ